MKKAIAVMVMVVIVVVYYFYMKDVGADNKNVPVKSEAYEHIVEINNDLNEHYPETAREIIEVHNKLMEIGYSKEMDDASVTEYANTLRLLYTSRFNELNPLEDQVDKILAERVENEAKPLIIIEDEILDVTISKDDEGKDEGADICVMHSTNAGEIKRNYYLVLEDNKWKIQSWETTKEDKSNETNVEE